MRIEEQKKFYEIARRRAADLDVYMEQYVSYFDLLCLRSNRTA